MPGVLNASQCHHCSVNHFQPSLILYILYEFLFSCLEEDTYSSYARQLSKYFLAEGVVCGHALFLASAEPEPSNILKVHP